MQYANILPAVFVDRPNRFIANILIDGQPRVCHVKNTGRCQELLLPGAQLYVQHFPGNTHRKTEYDLIAVYKGQRLINMDSQAPNKIFAQWAKSSGYFPGLRSIRAEYRWGSSRFDFLLDTDSGPVLVEVKGVTLERDGVVLFPDAPTLRGIRHLEGLGDWVAGGDAAYVVFIVQMEDVLYFTPNNATHAAFGQALAAAQALGVHLLALDCTVTADSITARREVDICLMLLE